MKKLRRWIRLIRRNRIVRTFTIISSITVILIISLIIAIIIPNLTKMKSSAAVVSDISGSDFTYISPSPEDADEIADAPEPVVDKEVKKFVPATKMDLKPSSITVYVNKEHSLPKDYKPKELVTPNIKFNNQSYDERTLMRKQAAKAIEKLFAAAAKKGYILSGVSGYRSYTRQYEIFTNNLATKGKTHTLNYSAIPGTSEHQTGLVMDVSMKSLHFDLSDKFAETPEGKWLAKNAYKYGFIIRYPKDKADITGYAYEPWHIRYVGRGLSYYLYKHKLTLDEYYKYKPSPNFNFEEVYADILNYNVPVYHKPTAKPTIKPTPADLTGAPDDSEDGDVIGDKEPKPTKIPTKAPTKAPTKTPTKTPTKKPTPSPTPTPKPKGDTDITGTPKE